MNPSRLVLPPQALLKSLLSYNPETGEFRWLVDRRPRTKAGSIAGVVNPDGYRQIGIGGKTFKAHRLAWMITYGECPPDILDHKNRIRDDNRISNLRVASDIENRYNCSDYRKRTTLPRGVYLQTTSGRFAASIKFEGVNRFLGNFATPEEAGQRYQEARREMFGEFAPD